MHPEILKFWEEQYHIIRYYHNSFHEVWYIDYIGYNNGYNICMIDKSNKNKRYYLDSKSYLEEEMLKLIKLKAFL